jgi:hypothetical protein
MLFHYGNDMITNSKTVGPICLCAMAMAALAVPYSFPLRLSRDFAVPTRNAQFTARKVFMEGASKPNRSESCCDALKVQVEPQ